MTKDKIVKLLEGYNPQEVDKFATYIIRMLLEKDKDGKIKNPWIQSKKEEYVVTKFKEVKELGLLFDGKHVSLGKRGLNFDYIAYKNLVIKVYPETKIDMQLVYQGDQFELSKESGSVNYNHIVKDPFIRDIKNIIGGYCVIKNRRGDFITLLNIEEIENHRKTSTMGNIWRDWYAEMCCKTLMKKACKPFSDDVFTNIQIIDNDANYNIDNPLDIDIEVKEKIDEITTVKELSEYYNQMKSKAKNIKAFNKYVSMKKAELSKEIENDNTHDETKKP